MDDDDDDDDDDDVVNVDDDDDEVCFEYGQGQVVQLFGPCVNSC